jgi:hypothetical protein
VDSFSRRDDKFSWRAHEKCYVGISEYQVSAAMDEREFMFHQQFHELEAYAYYPIPFPELDSFYFDCSNLPYDPRDPYQTETEVFFQKNMNHYGNKHSSRSLSYGNFPERHGFYSSGPPMNSFHEHPLAYEAGFMSPNMRQLNSPTNTQSLLHKLESTGRVPSREKFRRMICQVSVMTLHSHVFITSLLFSSL